VHIRSMSCKWPIKLPAETFDFMVSSTFASRIQARLASGDALSMSGTAAARYCEFQ
jgi:hypothetical protein